MSGVEVVFWSAVGLTAYAYFGYPVVVWLWSRCCPPAASRERHRVDAERSAPSEWPMVSLVISAYREEGVILQRLTNALLMDYPADRFEVVVGCDGAEDLTGELVRTVHDSRVRLIQFPERRGKASVLNDCIPQARGDIVVLSDANTMMEPQAIRRLVRHFHDAGVGGVCGKLVLTDPLTGRNADSLYWKYENFLKDCEGRLGALLGANGAIYALRKDLYDPIPPNTIIDDFLVGMRLYQRGYRLVYDSEALAFEETPATIEAEFHRRARIGAGGFQSLVWLWPLLGPKHGRLAFAFWSHKVLRWCCPLFLIAGLAANLMLMGNPFYARLLVVHALFYLVAVSGVGAARGRAWKPLRIPAMFVSMNSALLVGFWRWLHKSQDAAWKRTERTVPVQETEETEVTEKRAVHERVSS